MKENIINWTNVSERWTFITDDMKFFGRCHCNGGYEARKFYFFPFGNIGWRLIHESISCFVPKEWTFDTKEECETYIEYKLLKYSCYKCNSVKEL